MLPSTAVHEELAVWLVLRTAKPASMSTSLAFELLAALEVFSALMTSTLRPASTLKSSPVTSVLPPDLSIATAAYF
jgi:hypothetical protein